MLDLFYSKNSNYNGKSFDAHSITEKRMKEKNKMIRIISKNEIKSEGANKEYNNTIYYPHSSKE